MIGLVSFCAGQEYCEVMRPCIESIRSYGERHSHPFFFFDYPAITDRPAAWSKIPILLHLMQSRPEIKYFAWIDADAMITNPTFPLRYLTDMLERHFKYVLYCIDTGNNLNSGVGLYKNTLYVRNFLSKVWEYDEYIEHPWWENAAICRAAIDMQDFFSRVMRISNANICNSMIQGRSAWKIGDFVIHFAGLPQAARKTLIPAFATFISEIEAYLPPFDPDRLLLEF